MRWPSLVYGVIFEISSMLNAASSNLAPSVINKEENTTLKDVNESMGTPPYNYKAGSRAGPLLFLQSFYFQASY
jgi:hypothetical protein